MYHIKYINEGDEANPEYRSRLVAKINQNRFNQAAIWELAGKMQVPSEGYRKSKFSITPQQGEAPFPKWPKADSIRLGSGSWLAKCRYQEKAIENVNFQLRLGKIRQLFQNNPTPIR